MLTALLNISRVRLFGCPFILLLLQRTGVSRNGYIGNVTPTNYPSRRAYPGSNGIMIVTGNRQHLIRTDDLHHREYVMLLYTDCSGTRTGKRTTNV